MALDNAAKSPILDDLRAWNAAHAISIVFVTHAFRIAIRAGDIMIATGHALSG